MSDFVRVMLSVITSLLILCRTSAAMEDCDRGLTDGCSVPDGIPRIFTRTFTEACHKHDQCYACGVFDKFGLSRQECDDLFRDNMGDACDSFPFWVPSWIQRSCITARDVYYYAVVIAGESSYSTEAKGWCDESWVENCLV